LVTEGWRRALTVRHWPGLAEAAALLLWAHVSLRRKPPADVIAHATSGVRRHRDAGDEPGVRREVARAVWLVGAMSRHIVRVPCLSRSVALARMLARRNVASEIRIGVRTREDRLEAHAWVEVDGRAVNDREDIVRGYAPFDQPLSRLGELRRHFR
jgi:hypothetical protein